MYGAAGSLALVLIWVYYTSMIVLFGAEFTKLWAQRYGKGIVPVKGAVAYVEEERSVRDRGERAGRVPRLAVSRPGTPHTSASAAPSDATHHPEGG